MAETHDIERRGIEALRRHLAKEGRSVENSKVKTFDLVVDGVPAEVKCKRKPWSKLDFVGLTQKQWIEVNRQDCFLFIVCGLEGVLPPEIVEIKSKDLRGAQHVVESVYYFYRPELKRISSKD